ncbi:MAG: zf-HC2 domain-containing protein [Herpetosiphonaceae bacterium]|nr:zf-HC2 domain-containing protein [Herpetosiphonaceae bacterium]
MNLEELLPDYVAGELSDDERERVRAALQTSPQLWAELARYQQLFLLLAATSAQEVSAPGDLHARIARQVALRSFLNRAASLANELLGAYGRALVYYLGLR